VGLTTLVADWRRAMEATVTRLVDYLDETAKEDNENSAELASGIVMLPFICEVKGLIDSIRGEDLFTGHHMSW
jgi:hypothetical protein